MPKITDSRQHARAGLSFIVGAQPKTGKTFFAATGSDFFTTSKTLSDTYFLQFDPGGIRGLIEAGCTIPHLWDFSQAKEEDLVKELTAALDDVAKVGKDGALKLVVIDTISELAGRAEKHAQGITKGQDSWNHVAAIHQRLVHTLARYPIHKVYLTHWKENFQDDTAKKAAGVAGDSDIVIAVAGRGANAYLQSADVIGQLLKPPSGERIFKAHGGKGYQGGSRLECLGEREPADLAAIIEKINNKLLGNTPK